MSLEKLPTVVQGNEVATIERFLADDDEATCYSAKRVIECLLGSPAIAPLCVEDAPV